MDDFWYQIFEKLLPTLTFFMGMIGAWLRDRRSDRISRERKAVEFQAQNYLGLQVELQRLSVATVNVFVKKMEQNRGLSPSCPDAHKEAAEALASTHVLEERVLLDEVRSCVEAARQAVASLSLHRNYDEKTEADFENAVNLISAAQRAIGTAVRRLMS